MQVWRRFGAWHTSILQNYLKRESWLSYAVLEAGHCFYEAEIFRTTCTQYQPLDTNFRYKLYLIQIYIIFDINYRNVNFS